MNVRRELRASAQQRLSKEEKDVSKELEAYRQSLLRYRYEQRYVNERLDTTVSEKQISDYYDSHKETFKLERPILKARFLNIDKDSPNLAKIKKLMSSDKVGDYVVSGGEIPAALLADSIVRLIPGALTDETSALSDSFQDGLLSPPVYTRPADYKGWKVPEVLLSGNPKLIQEWQDEQALQRTKALRPELLEKAENQR